MVGARWPDPARGCLRHAEALQRGSACGARGAPSTAAMRFPGTSSSISASPVQPVFGSRRSEARRADPAGRRRGGTGSRSAAKGGSPPRFFCGSGSEAGAEGSTSSSRSAATSGSVSAMKSSRSPATGRASAAVLRELAVDVEADALLPRAVTRRASRRRARADLALALDEQNARTSGARKRNSVRSLLAFDVRGSGRRP